MDELAPIARAFETALGERLVSLLVYGSAVTGDVIPGFSDLDLAVVAHGRMGLEEASALQPLVAAAKPEQCAYVQMSHWIDLDGEIPRPLFVPGQFRVLTGAPVAEPFLHDEHSLRASGRAWLGQLPELVRKDAADFAVATAEMPRLVRLLATRLKPTIRAALVERGEPPIEAWAMTWDELASTWGRSDPEGAEVLRWVIGRLPPEAGAEAEVAELLLRLLWAGMD